ncbi:NAD(P)/FAD-dependent oxidoreductase [Flavimaricola marinus]|uniref:4-methylaminobutanoate oxidase (Formaldehyde-forming) n=1 Tax=Flavimaricola marinus TaxID=1819565 RepID=A0A238L9Q6_9RHOB|nr:FAD-binding oxidoreductase [Flavimaricola marinus]SMY06144.1 4-methylaminobutanoate oxidase (formaldehyde-forming) [Flavimaricola marinus]
MALPIRPTHQTYDIVVIGGAMMGSAVAWWCARNPDFQGRILVIEADPTFEHAATSLTNSCIRQQFGTAVNIQISQFGAMFIDRFKEFMEDDSAPDIPIQSFGYMYLADNDSFAETLANSQLLQASLGAGTQMLSPAKLAAAYPFYNLDGIIAASHNPVNEGYFDGGTIFDWLRKKGGQLGVERIHNRATGLRLGANKVTHVALASGESISCGAVVNCAGTRGAEISAMIDAPLPIEPRLRYTYVFEAETPLPRDLPLTIDPSGIHVRSDGRYYMAGAAPDDDHPRDPDDFAMDHNLWEDKVWPALAHRIPAFERIKLRNTWAGHYDYNTLDQNAVLGPHPEVRNFHFCNGFSGHGLQQSPAVGRGLSELLIYGAYRSLDLTALGYERIRANAALTERAVI